MARRKSTRPKAEEEAQANSPGELAVAPPALRSAAVFVNSFSGLNRPLGSTGFRTSQRRCDAAANPADEWGIAHTFLLNTRLRRGDRENEQSITSYFDDVAATLLSMSGQRDLGGLPAVPMPRPTSMRLGLSDVLARRRSARSYTGDPIQLSELSAILAAAGGVTDRPEVPLQGGGSVTLQFRSVASAGGLFPIDIYLAALAVQGLSRGIYRFDPSQDRLIRLFEGGQVGALLECFAVPKEMIAIDLACGVFFLIGQPWRSMRKYGDRGMRFVLMEAGAIAHSIGLACAALGYGSVECASVYDDEAHEALLIDGLDLTLLHCVIFGCPG